MIAEHISNGDAARCLLKLASYSMNVVTEALALASIILLLSNYSRCALTVAKDRRFVIVENLLSPTLWRQTVAKVLFEVMDAPSILFAPAHLLATFPFAASDALVIDMGYSEAVVIPVRIF